MPGDSDTRTFTCILVIKQTASEGVLMVMMEVMMEVLVVVEELVMERWR